MIKRFGTFVMISIGESILSMTINEDARFLKSYVSTFFSFAMMYFIMLIYFESYAPKQAHALNTIEFPGSVLWVIIHAFLAYLLLCMGVGFKLLLLIADINHAHISFRLLLGFSTSAVLICMLVIRTAHAKFGWTLITNLRLIPVIMAPLGVYWTQDTTEYIAWNCSMCFLFYLQDKILINRYEVIPEWHHPEHTIVVTFLWHNLHVHPLYLLYDFFIKCDTKSRKYSGDLEKDLDNVQIHASDPCLHSKSVIHSKSAESIQ